jgi:flavodoxin
MKTVVISYSKTGNNEALAASLAAALGAEHAMITEPRPRTMGTIVWDILFGRTPRIDLPVKALEAYDLVLFCGPVWMGQVATPLRACFKQLGPKQPYAFISICGGADGPNPKIADELESRLGRTPACTIDLHIADLLPADPKPTRQDTMAYRITESDVGPLVDRIVSTLRQTIAGSGVSP